MEIIKINKKIQLKDGSEVIEEYDFQDTINFEKLVKKLLSNNLKQQYEIANKIQNVNDEEENLVQLITEIIKDYNAKVAAYNDFIEKNKADEK